MEIRVMVWMFALLATATPYFETEQEGIRIRAEVAASRYTWTITNVSAPPVTGFAIDVHHTYDFIAPEGWDHTEPRPAGEFRAWARNRAGAIGQGRSAVFSARVNSRGAILGVGSGRIETADGATMSVAEVWRPVPESTRTRLIVAGVLVALALLHLLVGRLRGRNAPIEISASSGPPA
jgi:hypothetical protein